MLHIFWKQIIFDDGELKSRTSYRGTRCCGDATLQCFIYYHLWYEVHTHVKSFTVTAKCC